MVEQLKENKDTHIKHIVENLPECPGCYQHMDKDGKIIYIGKAKNLKRRVASYFIKEHESAKTRLLVSKICDIKYIVVKSEADALLLENNLIKKYKPRYNVLLKDDKTYPSVCVTHEDYPRIFKTRNRNLPHCTYFGPFSHAGSLHALLELCRKLYQPRSCKYPLHPDAIKKGAYKVCLDYHIKKCKAPCVGLQSKEAYGSAIAACVQLLKGKTAEVAREMMQKMKQLATEMQFEAAEEIKQQYLMIEQYRAKSEVVSNTLHNIDVFSIESDQQAGYINYLHVDSGAITQAFTFTYKKKLDETDEDLLALGIVEMRTRYQSMAKEIIVPFAIGLPWENVTIIIPQKGDKKKLLDLSILNVKQYKFDRLKQQDKLNPEQKQMRLMKELQSLLNMDHLPLRIELFDNSNISGTDAVAACVVFERMKPAKKEYRKYNIKTVEGPDDYASMYEVMLRRYSRIKNEKGTLPSLIMVDGGKGQMEVARKVMECLEIDIPIAGLAKDDTHRTQTLLFGFPPLSIGIKTDSVLFRLLTHMQDEVHRYAISFHREKRSKRQTTSILDDIKGIGKTTKTLILSKYGSVARIKLASLEQLSEIIGEKKALLIYQALHNTNEEGDINDEKELTL